jgi:regulator of protease activity HflC (stomatin/prohibitin superfamily)
VIEIARGLAGGKVLDFVSAANFAMPITVGLFVAFTGFIFARYVAGMAKQPVWSSLKAGAAMSIGASLAGLLLAIAQFIDYYGPNDPIRWLHAIYAVLMFLVAAEFVLNFLMGIYRPRKPGEVPPPAFNSRLLGFAAAPDRIAESIGGAISYQFGFDVTGSWFYQLLSRSLVWLVGVGVLVMWAMTALTVVKPNEQAVRVRFGKLVSQAPLQPGSYLKLPWPFESIETFAATTARRLDLGSETPQLKGRSILWTNEHVSKEVKFAVQPSSASGAVSGVGGGADSASGSSGERLRDIALVSAEIPLIYVVDDVVKFETFATSDTREEILRSVGQREVFRHLATQSVDQVLGANRGEISRELRARVQKTLDDLNSGVRVLFVGIEGVHPPKDAAASFESIVQSGQRRDASIRTAEREANTKLIAVAGSVETARKIADAIRAYEAHKSRGPASADAAGREAFDREVKEHELSIEQLLSKAGGQAASTILNARAERWVKHMEARGQAESQAGRLAGYRAAPEVYVSQVYFDTWRELMSKSRVYIVSDASNVWVEADLKEADLGGNIFTKPKESQDE